jgi:hypothetical protein
LGVEISIIKISVKEHEKQYYDKIIFDLFFAIDDTRAIIIIGQISHMHSEKFRQEKFNMSISQYPNFEIDPIL